MHIFSRTRRVNPRFFAGFRDFYSPLYDLDLKYWVPQNHCEEKHMLYSENFLRIWHFEHLKGAILYLMLKGFKDFLIRGNVIDLAVGLIMGTAFTAVVTALVQSVLMPAISMLIQSPNFDEFLVFGQIKVGVFLTAVVNFILIAAAVYFAIVVPTQKLTELALAKKKAEDEAVKKEETELDLLKEIRDALAKK